MSVSPRPGGDELTYPAVGATSGRLLPAGYHHLRRSEAVGQGGDAFRRAADLLMTWEMHRRAGLTVNAEAPRAEVGSVVALGWGAGRLRVAARCRVVAVTERLDEAGFAYGTLPGHPERGEEAFTVRLAPDGQVTLHIVAFSRPALWYARLGAPASRLVQHRITSRYLRALRPG